MPRRSSVRTRGRRRFVFAPALWCRRRVGASGGGLPAAVLRRRRFVLQAVGRVTTLTRGAVNGSRPRQTALRRVRLQWAQATGLLLHVCREIAPVQGSPHAKLDGGFVIQKVSASAAGAAPARPPRRAASSGWRRREELQTRVLAA